MKKMIVRVATFVSCLMIMLFCMTSCGAKTITGAETYGGTYSFDYIEARVTVKMTGTLPETVNGGAEIETDYEIIYQVKNNGDLPELIGGGKLDATHAVYGAYVATGLNLKADGTAIVSKTNGSVTETKNATWSVNKTDSTKVDVQNDTAAISSYKTASDKLIAEVVKGDLSVNVVFKRTALAEIDNTNWTSYVILGVAVVAIIVMFVFSGRKNKNSQKEYIEQLAAIQPGNKVKTAGGICGIVVNVCEEDNTVVIETGSEVSGKSYIKLDKELIAQTDAKGPTQLAREAAEAARKAEKEAAEADTSAEKEQSVEETPATEDVKDEDTKAE